MAAKLQSPPAATFPSSSSSAQAAAHYNSSQLVDINPPVRSAARVPQNTISTQHTNPFRTPKHTPHTSDTSSHLAFSPISPIEEEQDNRSRQRTQRPPQSSSRSHAMSSEPRKSVDLRKLDGKPYPGREDEADQKPRKVKVAQDMYAGDMPPGYERQDYEGPLAHKEGHTGSCHKCGGHKKTASGSSVPVTDEKPQVAQNIDCNKCGGTKSMPPSSFPRGAMANARAPRQAAPRQSSEAGPSSAPGGHRHKCGKCGRRKRPESISTDGSSPRQIGLSYQNVPTIQTNGGPVGINIEPPTAITERAPTLPFSPASTVGETPLIKPNAYKERPKPSRSGSLSSLLRSFSRRKQPSAQSPLPSQQLASNGEHNSHNIVDKISSAIRDGDSSYSRLRPEDYPERPVSPFSFVDKPQEENAFEMNDMRKSKQPERRNSWDKADESDMFLGESARPRYSRSQSTQHGLKPELAAQYQNDTYLSLPPDQRPGVTRFKSLRSGVTRATNGLSRSASQISRSTSLRRLESVKKVPQLWYRDDMAIEGAQGEYNNYGY
ncbi:hypothetical protein OHC33_007814 [Knufia fluminis]|uniref:Uncharacterized protein n=1 Tax=Knufia fluminis TaxID=191047 RepID=A0AAN8EP91_9EURO|nr:hypothetical protein OHC33_007814 [Knufia fluminis]